MEDSSTPGYLHLPPTRLAIMDCSSPLSSPPASSSSDLSSPLSTLSKSPSPPASPMLPLLPVPRSSSPLQDPAKRYPSPMSITASGTQSPAKKNSSRGINRARSPATSEMTTDADARPAKKRKITSPKERTTEYLDLTKADSEFTSFDEKQRQRLVAALKKKKKIVVIAGAGISVSANIPDFRSSQGLFAPAGTQPQKLKASGKHLFDAAVYKRDELTEEFHTMVRELASLSEKAKPTPFHHLLASLAQEGRLLRLYSQNIDCLDTQMQPLTTNIPLNAKGPWPTTIQLHGGLEKMVCQKCGQLESLQAGLFDGPETPLCEACKVHDQVRTTHAGKRSHGIGRLRPRFVLYNERNPDEEAIGKVCSADLNARPDAVIVVGTTLKVPGTRRLVKELCRVTRGRRDGFTAWINIDPEPKGIEFKDCWDMIVRSKCDVVANEVALPPWDCAVGDDYLVSPEQATENQRRWSRAGSSPRLEVQVPVKPKEVEELQAIPTPRPSPKISPANKSKKPKTVKGAKKTKQTTLSFGDQNPDQTKTTKPGTKANAGKRKRPLKDSQPNATVLNTFKSAKNLSDRSSDKGKPNSIKKDGAGRHPLPNERYGLPSLRPPKLDLVCNSGHMAGSPVEPFVAQSGPCSPLTPTVLLERPTSRDTISPTTVPKDMTNLVDIVQ